jgi:PAS domain S-box-containing protein
LITERAPDQALATDQTSTSQGVSVTEPASDASAATTSPPAAPASRRPAGLHPTGLVVAVVGLLLSATAFFVTYRDVQGREEERLDEVADQAADGVTGALRDVEDLVAGIEGTLIATEAPNEEQIERLMNVQLAQTDLISSATLLKAQESTGVSFFGQAGESRYVDIEALADPALLADRAATLSAIPEGAIRVVDNEPVGGQPAVALASAFTTRPTEGRDAPEWIVEVELTFPPEVIDSITAGLPGEPVVAVYVGDEQQPEAMLLGPASRDFSSSAEQAVPLLEDTALVAIAPTSDVLNDEERVIPLLFFLGGLAMTAILTPLVGRLASRREEVRVLSAQRDELDRALNVSKQIERELRASEQRFRSVLQSSPDVVLWIDPDRSTVQILNRDDLFGHAPETVATTDALLTLTHHEDIERTQEGLDKLRQEEWGTVTQFELRLERPDGEFEWLRLRGGRVQRDDGASGSILAVLTAITDQKWEESRRAALEAQLVQSQRLEAVGQLAGGVAHDFNNILAAIVSGAELVIDEVDGQAKDDVEEIRRTARRGSDLARQLLLFSRRDRGSAPEVVNVNEVVADVDTMLRRSIGETIELETDLTDDPHKVHIDPSQIERILMNLTINARDAMADGGHITIRTRNRNVDEDHASTRPGLSPGPYLELTVSDDGAGMSPDVVRHAFEPFFSTKEVGKGTGLGLATVYGIVQGAQGHIDLDSRLGVGTTFTILLPRTRLGTEVTEIRPEAEITGGTERILLVEDEPAVREAGRRLLERRGYDVTVAEDGATALEIAGRDQFDLLLTDVLMPGGMNGRDVVREVHKRQPRIAVLYMTGHSDDVLDHVGIDDDEGEALIVRKPFSEVELTRAIRAALARVPEPTS